MRQLEPVEPRRRQLYGLLGDLPPRDRPIRSTHVAVESRPQYVLEKLSLDLNDAEPVPAYFLTPVGAGSGPWPTVLYNHAHGDDYDLGKDEVLRGRPGMQEPPYGEALTAAGYAVLCIDMWSFGDRRGRSETALFKETLWKGQVLWGMMLYDTLTGCGLPHRAAGRRQHQDRDHGDVAGQHDGMVGGCARAADQGLR